MHPKRVLFALNPESVRDFFPQFNKADLPEMKDHWVNPPDLPAGEWERLLREIDPEVIVTGWDTPPLPETFAAGSGSSLRYVCHLAGSVRSLLPRTLLERNVLITNWGDSISHTIAEHALLLVLGALRNMPLWKSHLHTSGRRDLLETRSLRGKKIGLHGFGSIAREIVLLLKPFGVHLSAYSQGVPSGLFAEYSVNRLESLAELFSSSEVLIECEALTPDTEGSVNRNILSLLPPGAVFVNVGRGAIADECALAEAAASGRIRLAADVFVHEPLPQNSPLLEIDPALLSPHIAGPTQDSLSLCGDFALKNLRAYLLGKYDLMEGKITLAIFDRST